jgi:hypothetical protein
MRARHCCLESMQMRGKVELQNICSKAARTKEFAAQFAALVRTSYRKRYDFHALDSVRMQVDANRCRADDLQQVV